jgi:hypothetical protein
VNTKKVKTRREAQYCSLDDIAADAKRLTEVEVRTDGNWSQGQIYDHLAKNFNGSIGGMGFAMPAPVRFLMSALMKKKFLTKGLPPGFKTNAKLEPPEVSTSEGLDALTKAIERLKQEETRAMHPIFGNISREEWDQFHMRHAEMHMSFIMEAGTGSGGPGETDQSGE